VLARRDSAAARLDTIENRGEKLETLERELAACRAALDAAGKSLTTLRRKAAPKLAKEIASQLKDLGFKQSSFEAPLATLAEPGPQGFEAIEFQFGPNPGEPLLPLRQIASSGEISRVMLAVKSALADQDDTPLDGVSMRSTPTSAARSPARSAARWPRWAPATRWWPSRISRRSPPPRRSISSSKRKSRRPHPLARWPPFPLSGETRIQELVPHARRRRRTGPRHGRADRPVRACPQFHRRGPPAASEWREWLEIHGPKMLLFARQQTRSHEDAEDVFQDAAGQARRENPQRRVRRRPRGVAALSLHHHPPPRDRPQPPRRPPQTPRGSPSEPTSARPAESFHPWFESESSDDETRVQLEEKLKELPEKFAEVIVMKIWGERTFAEIGEILGISQNTAASRYRYGLEALKKSLGGARSRGDLSI
jgi:RNA polymerase sigma-70 factor, ECF subfamily